MLHHARNEIIVADVISYVNCVGERLHQLLLLVSMSPRDRLYRVCGHTARSVLECATPWTQRLTHIREIIIDIIYSLHALLAREMDGLRSTSS